MVLTKTFEIVRKNIKIIEIPKIENWSFQRSNFDIQVRGPYWFLIVKLISVFQAFKWCKFHWKRTSERRKQTNSCFRCQFSEFKKSEFQALNFLQKSWTSSGKVFSGLSEALSKCSRVVQKLLQSASALSEALAKSLCDFRNSWAASCSQLLGIGVLICPLSVLKYHHQGGAGAAKPPPPGWCWCWNYHHQGGAGAEITTTRVVAVLKLPPPGWCWFWNYNQQGGGGEAGALALGRASGC